MRLRSARSLRSSQNDTHLFAQGMDDSTDSGDFANNLPSLTDSIRSLFHTHFRPGYLYTSNSDQQNLSGRSENNTNDENSTERRPSSTARKVFDILDSPRRALMEKATRSTSKRKKPSMNSTFTSQIEDNPINKSRGYSSSRNMYDSDCMHVDEMEIDFEECSNGTNSTPTQSNEYNILTWLQHDAPHDIIPKVLSFIGPQKHLALSRVNKSLRKICLSDGVFRTMCEDYGKWEAGKDDGPDSHDVSMDIDGKVPNSNSFWRDVYCNKQLAAYRPLADTR